MDDKVTCYAKDCIWWEDNTCSCDGIELGNCGECLMYSEDDEEGADE